MGNDYKNNAYVVGLEILFLNKISKLRHNILVKDLEKIRQTAAEFQLEYEEYIESNYILLKSNNTRFNSLIRVLNISLKFKEMFIKSNAIFEFNILIFKTNIDPRLITQKIRRFLLNIPSDNKIWLLQEHNPIIHYSAQLSNFDKGIHEVIAINQEYSEQNFLEDCQKDILFHADLVDLINKDLQDIKVRTIGIVGKPNMGKTAFLRSFSQTETMKYIYLTAHSQFQEASYPFIMLLYQLKQYFYSYFQESQRLENLFQQIQRRNMLNYKQVEVDIFDLLQHLADQRMIVLICDNLDDWPIEAVELLQLIYQKLSDSHTQLKLLCCMIGIYYPIGLDEIIHFSGQYQEHLGRSEQAPLISFGESCNFSAKEKLLAILPSQRVDIKKYFDFYTLVIEGLKTQELTILSIIQKYPYILNSDILVHIFQNSIIYEVIDSLLDYYFLLEIEDHFGKHLFCTLNRDIYPINDKISKSIENNIVHFFEKSISYEKANIYSLYILSQNNIFLYEVLEYYLYKMISYGFIKTVRSFIDSGILGSYQPAIEMWGIMHKKSRLDLIKLQDYFDNYSIDKDNIRFLLPLSSYFYETHNYDKSLKINKESIYLFNNNLAYKIYTNRIFLIQIKIFISKCMFREAIEYINISLESLHNANRSCLFYRFIYLKLLCLFFERELHSAFSIIEKYDFDEYLNLYGEIENYFEINLLIMRIYFEIGQYLIARNMLVQLAELAKYYGFEQYLCSIRCWAARMSFYIGEFRQGFEFLESLAESEEKLYFLSEGYYFYDGKEEALRYAMLALELSLKKVTERKNIGYREFDNVYSLQEGVLLCCNGEKDPLLICIKGIAAYLHTFYGSLEIAGRILHRITQRPSSEFIPFQHISHYFYYLYLKKHSEGNNNSEDMLYLSYAISILQNESSKILSTNIRYNYIYNNYWNNLLSIEGKQHNLMILGNSHIR